MSAPLARTLHLGGPSGPTAPSLSPRSLSKRPLALPAETWPMCDADIAQGVKQALRAVLARFGDEARPTFSILSAFSGQGYRSQVLGQGVEFDAIVSLSSNILLVSHQTRT